MKKKSLLLVAVLLLSAGLTTSCGEEKVIFLNFKPEVADSYKGIAAAYKKDTGKTIEIQTAASGILRMSIFHLRIPICKHHKTDIIGHHQLRYFLSIVCQKDIQKQVIR